MAIDFSEDQKKVIYAPVSNILVSAAAGSGKTTVLVNRIIEHIKNPDNPLDVGRMLIVTFTKNAASLMRERIYEAIERECNINPDDNRLAAQLSKVAYADIMTIDKFCLRIVKSYFYAIESDANFRICDADEAGLYIEQSLEEVFNRKYEEKDNGFISLCECYGNEKNDNAVKEAVKNLMKACEAHPWPEKFLDEVKQLYDNDTEFDETQLAREILGYGRRIITDCHCLIQSAIHESEISEGCQIYTERLEEDDEIITELVRADKYSVFRKRLAEVKWKRIPSPPKDGCISEKGMQKIKSIRESYKGAVAKLSEGLFSQETEAIHIENTYAYPYICELIKLTSEVMDEYERIKKKHGVCTFADVSHMALEIICAKESDGSVVPSRYAKEISAKYDEIMIDEYQDSNSIQELILMSVSGESKGEPNVFMVGDVKQSIYRFRMAEPGLFMEKYDSYTEDSEKYRLICLKENYRSQKAVVECVNDIFEAAMTKEFCGIDYDDNAVLRQGAAYEGYDGSPGSESEMNVLICASTTEKEDRQRLMAKTIALRIKKLMKSGEVPVLDKDGYRPLKYGDLVILVRSMSGIASVLAEVLQDEGIPTSVATNRGYYKTREIRIMLSYLRILDNPYQDTDLAAVLFSYIGGLSVEEMALLKIFEKSFADECGKIYLWDIAEKYSESENADEKLGVKLKRFRNIYCELKDKKEYVSLYELILEIYEKTGFYNYVGILPAGEKRRANLDMLLKKAGAYEKNNESGMEGFLTYVDRLIKYDMDNGEADISDGVDSVSIMTIHKSKGLEYPVVILADMDKEFNFTDSKRPFTVQANKGMGIKLINTEKRTQRKTVQKEYLDTFCRTETIAEEIRILYVALTRARQKLIMYSTCAYKGDAAFESETLQKCFSKWLIEAENSERRLSFNYLASVNGYDDLVMPVFLKKTRFLNKEMSREYISDGLKLSIIMEDEVIGNIAETCVESCNDVIIEAEDMVCYEDIEKYFSYVYPYAYDEVPVKYSVSELKHEAMEKRFDDITDEIKPVRMFEDNPGDNMVTAGAKRGTLMHLFMEYAVKNKCLSRDALENLLNMMIEKGKISEDESKLVSVGKAAAFMEKPIAKRMFAAAEKGQLFLENPFVYGIKACELKPELYQSDEKILIQGVIDAFFIEDDEIVILDYKTDRVLDGDILAEMYEKQMELYAEALCSILKKRIKDVILYSFSLEKGIECKDVVKKLRKDM